MALSICLSSFPSHLLCLGKHLTHEGVVDCLELPGKAKEGQAWADPGRVPKLPALYFPTPAAGPPAVIPRAKVPLKISAPPVLWLS